jgi:hypothetical protein
MLERMSFEDLPDDWPDLPLDDARLIEDVLDLFVSMRARFDGALLFLLCDESRRALQPILVDEIDVAPPPDSDLMLDNLVTAIVDARADLSVLVAVARPGRLRAFPCDHAWAQCISRACADRLPVIGIHLVTPRGSLPIQAEPLVA